MNCPHCGAMVDEATQFCPQCGARLQKGGVIFDPQAGCILAVLAVIFGVAGSCPMLVGQTDEVAMLICLLFVALAAICALGFFWRKK